MTQTRKELSSVAHWHLEPLGRYYQGDTFIAYSATVLALYYMDIQSCLPQGPLLYASTSSQSHGAISLMSGTMRSISECVRRAEHCGKFPCGSYRAGA